MRILISLAVVVLSLACSSQTEDAPPDAQWKLVADHFFIERKPKDFRDMVHQIAFITENEERRHRIGIRGHSSQVRIFIDVLLWDRKGDTVSMKILQTGDTHRGTFKAWSCAGSAPDGFEICLELREGDRVRRYYSKHDWVIDDVSDVERYMELVSPPDGTTPSTAY